MGQVKIYGLAPTLETHRAALSEAIHAAIMQALHYPPTKKFQRFIGLATEDFIFPDDRSGTYLIIEIALFEGRSAAAKKQLIRLLFGLIEQHTGITTNDIEIQLYESPRANWGIRGLPGDELALDYHVKV